jgi:hypothetical protein
MGTNRHRLQVALSTFGTFEGATSRASQILSLHGRIYRAASSDRSFQSLLPISSNILEDLWNIETIALRLDSDRRRHEADELSDSLWMQFASCDVTLFHATLRSMFDFMAQMIKQLSSKPGQVPNSFEDLRNFVQNSSNRSNRVGETLSELIISCDWFSDIRKVRDSIVHRGGSTLVFPEKSKILFQVHEGFRNQIFIPEVMENDNVVDFELYGGLILGYLYSFLEDFSGVAAHILKFTDLRNGSKTAHPGLDVVKKWITKVNDVPPATGA